MRTEQTLADKVRENRVRRWAKRLGLQLIRSRAKRLHVDDYGLYMLVDENAVVAGIKFDATLEDIESDLQRIEGELK